MNPMPPLKPPSKEETFSRSLPGFLDPDAPQGFAAADQGNPVPGT
jgi:hypothetical protein